MTGISRPPWTLEQVASLNAYQLSASMHPFTCGNGECRAEYGDPLFATPSGWACVRCSWRQFWAWAWMTDGSWLNPDPAYALDLFCSTHEPGPVPAGVSMPFTWRAGRYWLKLEAARQRETADRAAWLEGIKRRLGLIAIGDQPDETTGFARWPVLLRDDWPAGCRCVIVGRVRLTSECPVHDGPWSHLEISNCDPGIPAALEDDLRRGLRTHHNGWDFTGHVWWDEPAGLFREEVFRFHVSRGVRSAPTLARLVAAVNDEFGWK